MKPPSLKNRKPSVYLFFSLYCLCCVFFLVESSFPGDLSSQQSGIVSDAVAFFLNLFKDATPANKVQPIGLALASDSTFLNLANPDLPIPEIAQGTTTQLTYRVEPPALKKGDYLDPSFTVTRQDASDEEDYRLVVDASSDIVRIESVGKAMSDCKITVTAGSSVSADYAFSIVENPAPTEYFVAENGKTITLRQNETYPLSLTLQDPISKGHDDYYLRRVYDPTKLPHSPVKGDSGISVDEFGVISAHQAGTYQAYFGTARIDVNVIAESLAGTDGTSSLTVEKTNPEGRIALHDYDYYEKNPEKNGIDLAAQWQGRAPSDTSLIWFSSDPLIARVVSQEGLSCHVVGYRKTGSVTLFARSNVDPSVKAGIVLTPEEIYPSPSQWDLRYKTSGSSEWKELPQNLVVHKGGVITIENYIDPSVNVTENYLLAEADDPHFSVHGSGTPYVSLSFEQVGPAGLSLSSLGNPNLKTEIHFTIEAEQNVDAGDATFQGFIRKLVGHGTWFAITGAIGAIFFALYFADEKKLALGFFLGSGVGLTVAASSELIQHFVPGRVGAFSDIGIDMTGYLIGALFMWAVLALIAYAKRRRLKNRSH